MSVQQKQEVVTFLGLNLSQIVQTILVALMLAAITWFGDRVDDLSTNLTKTIERQEALLVRIEAIEQRLERDEERVRDLELETARNERGLN